MAHSKKQIGYHYTGWENWLKIREQGIIPYRMTQNAFRQYNVTPMGIWLWKRQQFGQEHVGNLIFQAGAKCTLHIVQLAVQYRPEDIYRLPNGASLWITHTGTLSASRDETLVNEFRYHEQIESVVVTRPIPAEDVTLIGDYNMVERLM